MDFGHRKDCHKGCMCCSIHMCKINVSTEWHACKRHKAEGPKATELLTLANLDLTMTFRATVRTGVQQPSLLEVDETRLPVELTDAISSGPELDTTRLAPVD